MAFVIRLLAMQGTQSVSLPPRVFISYSRESLEHMERVLGFANWLRANGVDSVVDRYFEDTLNMRWAEWMKQEIEAANFVLVVATPGYLERMKAGGTVKSGRGVNFEGAIVTQYLYELDGKNNKFFAVYFDADGRASIPIELRGFMDYDVVQDEGKIKLYRRLTNQPEVIPPKLGDIKKPGQLYPQPAPPVIMSPRQEAVKERIETLGNAYQQLRQSTLPSEVRSQKMSILAAKMRALASDAYFLLDYLAKNPAPGHRLAAVSLLAVNPNPEYLEWLSERLAPEKPFVGYHAARALQSAARVLGAEFRVRTKQAIDDAVRRLGTGLENTDRADALREARRDLRITEELVRDFSIPDSHVV